MVSEKGYSVCYRKRTGKRRCLYFPLARSRKGARDDFFAFHPRISATRKLSIKKGRPKRWKDMRKA